MPIVKLSDLGAVGLSLEDERPGGLQRFTTLHGFRPTSRGLSAMVRDYTNRSYSVGITGGIYYAGVSDGSSRAGVLFYENSNSCSALTGTGTDTTINMGSSQSSHGRADVVPHGSQLLYNSGYNRPVLLDAFNATSAVLSSMDLNMMCKKVAVYKERIFALGTTENAIPTEHFQRVRYSSVVAPGEGPASWDESDPASGAGYFELVDAYGAIVDAKPLGGALMVYCEGSVHEVQYVGGTNLFAQRKVASVGVPARDCVAEIGGRHIVFTFDDLMAVDGGGAQSILSESQREILFSSTYLGAGMEDRHIVYRADKGLLYVYAGAAAPGSELYYIVIDLASGKWFTDSIPDSSAMLIYDWLPSSSPKTATSGASLIRIDSSGSTPIYECGDGLTDNPKAETTRFLIGSDENKIVEQIRLHGSGLNDGATHSIDIEITGEDVIGDGSGHSAFTVTTETNGNFLDGRWIEAEIPGTYFGLSLSKTDNSQSTVITDIEIDYTEAGDSI